MFFLFLTIQLGLGNISIYSPSSLKEKFPSGISASLGNFGNPPYDTSVVGLLWYPESDSLGCQPFLSPSPFGENENFFVLIDRGECAFVLKVRHAQDRGARAVIIVNNELGEVSNIIMRDNGLGGNLYIPAFLIKKTDGEEIKKVLEKTDVSLVLNFEMTSTSEMIYLSLFFSSGNERSQEFMKDFADIGKYLTKANTDFTPKYVVIQCLTCEFDNFSKSEIDCLGGGRYCAPDPDGPGPITGKNIVQEDLRQLCMFDQIKDDSKVLSYKNYFKFQERFAKECGLTDYTKKCSEKIIKSLGFDMGLLEKCYQESFEGGKETDIAVNKRLGAEIDFWLSNGLNFYPAVIVNGQLYRGDLDNDAVIVGICAGYSYMSRPDFCKSKPTEKTASGFRTSTVIIALLIFFAVLFAVLLIYRYISKKELEKEMVLMVNQGVSQYFALSETSTLKKSDRQTGRSSFV